MREIKFRRWDKKKLKIEYVLQDCSGEAGWSPGEGREFGIIDDLNDVFIDEDYVYMQYTGLKDQNGIEIYEGDIVSYPGRPLTFVEYKRGFFGVNFMPEKKYDVLIYSLEQFTVMGNIYENPELLMKVKRRYVLVRTTAGVIFSGELESILAEDDGKKEVILGNARRIIYLEKDTLSQLALDGASSPEFCKFSSESEQKISNVIEILDVTEKAKKSIKEVPIYDGSGAIHCRHCGLTANQRHILERLKEEL